MSDILLTKPKLDPSVIDLSVGEPYLVREHLFKTFQLEDELKRSTVSMDDLSYPSSTGYAPLVRHLEDKHGSPVIITNGAKQGLAANFYALNKLGYSTVFQKCPYWALIPPLANIYGITPICLDYKTYKGYPQLLLSPNNPDGHCESPAELKEMQAHFKEKKLPLIHDAVYYNHIYLPKTHTLPKIGDTQIYSFSKSLGISSARVGYVVCSNPIFYNYIKEYVEATTVGVSVNAQAFLFDILDRRMRSYPTLVERFENLCFSDLQRNKKMLLNINPELLEVPQDIELTNGMFAFLKVGKIDFSKSKVYVVDGAHFGKPGFIRMNLAFNEETMKDIVNRINAVEV
jgi:aspartate/methionine/tyrosine aminotransferase